MDMKKILTLLLIGFIASLCAGCRGAAQKTARGESGSAAPVCVQNSCPDGSCFVPAGQYTVGMTAEQAARMNEVCDKTADTKWGDVCDRARLATPRVTVQLKAFCMDRTEVTQARYQKVMKENPSSFRACGGECPAETVSWHDAARFCGAAGKRLPTGAEWEAAAHGAATDAGHAWTRENSGVDYANSYQGHGAHPVAQKQPGAFGLNDMLGNVYEWTSDCRGDNPARRCEVRGGSWFDARYNIAPAVRHNYDPDFGDPLIGFRCASDAR